MSVKVYAHFVADLGAKGCSEFRGIVELLAEDVLGRGNDALARELARDFNVQSEHIRVLRWARLH